MSEQGTAEQFAMPKHGQICWNELATNNAEESKNFYSELFGWTLQGKAMGEGENEMKYYEFSNGAGSFGGMWEINDACGNETGEKPSPHWMTYVAVDDVDASTAKVTELGGNICMPPTDIPTVGRFCIVSDPSGATFSLITLKAA